MGKSHYRKFTIYLIAVILIFLSSHPSLTAAEQVDPFYTNLLEDGKFFYSQGNIIESAENFKVASFGFLDNPEILLECYIYLSVCHCLLKNTESSQHYINEIKRLDLDGYLDKINIPEDLLDKYNEISSTSVQTFSKGTRSITNPSQKQLLDDEISRLKQEIKNNKLDPGPYYKLSELYLEQNNFSKARSALKDFLRLDPNNGNAHFEMGKIYLRERKYKKAVNPLLKAARLMTENIDIHYQLGETYYRLKKFEEAEQAFLNVQGIKQGYKDTRRYLVYLGVIPSDLEGDIDQSFYVSLARRTGTLDKKMMYYRQALKLDSSNIDIYFEMSGVYKKHKKYDDAAEILEILFTSYPNNMRIYTELGEIHLLDKSYDKALSTLTDAKAVDGKDIETCYLLGKTYMKKKRYKEAAAQFRIVLRQDPQHKDTQTLWQSCLRKLK